jgi:hypothetical protein
LAKLSRLNGGFKLKKRPQTNQMRIAAFILLEKKVSLEQKMLDLFLI